MSRRTLLMIAITAPVLALIVAGLTRPQSAAAHPLGNFTVNRYSRLELYSDTVRIRYVLDMAEIPAFQEIGEIDSNGDGATDPAESEDYLGRKAADIKDNLHLSVDGSTAALELLSSDVTFPEGQAGLRTLRIDLLLHAPSSKADATLEYRDENYADRVGWRDRGATGAGRQRLKLLGGER